jgi:hypothetical protein
MPISSAQITQIRFIDDIYKPRINKLQFPLPNLDNGIKLLYEELECDTYIAVYGGHHFHKLYTAFPSTNFHYIEGKSIEIIDWGCGQALATCILMDYLIENRINPKIKSITLIEPSTFALWRGYSFVRQMLQSTSYSKSITTVNKYIDNLSSSDFVSENDNIKIHLFSNIIDVEGFNLAHLYKTITNSFKGVNRIICTSPYNNRYHRMNDFYQLFNEVHSIKNSFHSNEDIYQEIFYIKNRQFETRKIKRYERQFTIIL